MMKNSSVKTFLRMLEMLISGQHSQDLTTINCTELRIHHQSPDHCTLPHLGPIQVTVDPSFVFGHLKLFISISKNAKNNGNGKMT